MLINERTKIDIKYAKCIFKLNVKENYNGCSTSTKNIYEYLDGI